MASSSSTTLSCISSALDDLEFLKDFVGAATRNSLSGQIGHFVCLRTFLVCSRKWGKHVHDASSLGALLLRIEDVISQRTREIHSSRLSASEGAGDCNVFDDSSFNEEIRSFKMELDQLFDVSSDRSSRQSSDSPVNKDDVLELLDSLLEMLADLGFWRRLDVQLYTEGFSEKLTFLKSFLHFTTLHEVQDGKLGVLLTQIEGVLVNVARHAVFRCFFRFPNEMNEEDNYYELLKSMVPEGTCKALIASNLSRNSCREVDEHILREIVDVLLVSLWDILKSGTFLVIHQRDQLQKLYQGLRCLRLIIPKMQPKKFDKRMRDLTGDVIYDAGLAIFSLTLDAMDGGLVQDMDLVPFDLLENFKVIQATVADEFPERSSVNFPRTDELGFLDFLLNHMMYLTSPEADSLPLVSCPVQTIQEELSFLRSFMGKIVKLRDEDEELQSLWDRVMEVAYKVEMLIDSLLVGYILYSTSMSFNSILQNIKIIKTEALYFDSKSFNLKVDEVTKKFNHMPSQGSKPMVSDVVVGFEDEARSVINRLTRGSCQLQIVPIVGMAGLGKTTLANKVYNDNAIVSHFHTRAWCTVSQSHQKRNLLLEILTSIDSRLPQKLFEMSEEDLALQVKRRFLRNKYLIVLDDVWDIEVWNGLQASFPDDRNGSRVILTSRLCDVAPQDRLDKEPHFLRQLTQDESWDLLKEKFSPGKDILPPELCELRKEIVELCQGLPLTIVILAGVLANMDQSGWKDVVQSLSSSNISASEQCATALDLSYRHLPFNLKPCILYFGGFPEDHEHNITELIWLWVAEGFAQTTHTRSAEDVANDYLINLIGRSLVMVSKERSVGGIKSCQIHDLLHEFCVTKAKEEKFLHLVRGHDELYTLYVPHYLRRLCIKSQPGHFEESRLSFPTIRSLLFFNLGPIDPDTSFDLSFIFQVFKLLRVLDLRQVNLGTYLPREIKLLIQLRYLAILGSMTTIPSSIAKLSNLETLIVKNPFGYLIVFPDTIWNMKKLRHLQLKDEKLVGGFYLPTENLDESSGLCNLYTFSTIYLRSWEEMEKMLKKLPNVRTLKFKLGCIFGEKGSKKILALDCLSQLISLNLKFASIIDMQYQYEFHISMTIEKLTLSGFRLPWSQISIFANLPNLKVLKLLEDAFVGEAWSMGEEEFPNLGFLKLASLDIVRWTGFECENRFPCLKKLVLVKCRNLVEIPSSLGNVPTLEMIELSRCRKCASSVEKIKEEQIFSTGYTDLKIISSS